MGDDDRDERQVTLKVGVPVPVPLAVELSYRWIGERRSRRAERLLEAISEQVSRTMEEVVARMAVDGDPVADLLERAVVAAIDVVDDRTLHALAKVAASAFEDDAQLDEVAFRLATIVDLGPIHVRVMAILPPGRSMNVQSIAAAVGASPAAVVSVMTQLQARSLVYKASEADRHQTSDEGIEFVQWQLSGFGIDVLRTLTG